MTTCKEPCCPALPVNGSVYCSVHQTAKRAAYVLAGTKCTRCGRQLEAGALVTKDSTNEQMTRAECPCKRPRRKMSDAPSLLDL